MKNKFKLLLALLAAMGVMSIASGCDQLFGGGSSESDSESVSVSESVDESSEDEDESSEDESSEDESSEDESSEDESSEDEDESSEDEETTYTVTFVADGVTVEEVEYVEGATEITEPEVPAKEHYTGAWEVYELDGNVTVNAVYTAIEYTVTFVADGETVDTVSYTVEDMSIFTPRIPAKEGYGAKWDTFELTGGDITVNAIYTAGVYYVNFYADGIPVGEPVEFTVETTEITAPAVPAKAGYEGAWETYELGTGDVDVNAVYTAIEYTLEFAHPRTGPIMELSTTFTVETKDQLVFPEVPEGYLMEGYNVTWDKTPADLALENTTVTLTFSAIEYTVSFVADGAEVGTATYTVENTAITEPEVPAKDYYTGAWEAYELTTGDVTVNAVYTANEYTVSFVADGAEVDTATYTVENTAIAEPEVPAKDYYTGAWEGYTLTGGDVTVNAVYTPVEYTVTFMNGEEVVDTVAFTVEDNNKNAPAAPEKTGYTGAWEAYDFSNFEDQVVSVSYTANVYTITFDALGGTVSAESQEVTFDSEYAVSATATSSKVYQEFLGWADADGNKVTSGTWTVAGDVTLTAIYSEGMSFESGAIPTWLSAANDAGTLAITDTASDGSKALVIPVTGAAPSLKITIDALGQFFADENVEYVAFDAKSDTTETANFRRYTWRPSTSALGNEMYEPDRQNYNCGIKTYWKTFYFSRTDYNYWVANGIGTTNTNNYLIIPGGFTSGDNLYVDNIRPVGHSAIYGFEGGGLRTGSAVYYYMPTPVYNSEWSLAITGTSITESKMVEGKDGGKALQWTRGAGSSNIYVKRGRFMQEDLVEDGTKVIAFDVYVPEGADTTISIDEGVTTYPTNAIIKGAWNTIYVKSDMWVENFIVITDTTGGTYKLDNIRQVSDAEAAQAIYGFENSGGGLRDNTNNPDENGNTAIYYYAGGYGGDHNKNVFSFAVSGAEGILSNPSFDTKNVHNGNYSMKFDKTNGYIMMTMRTDSQAYATLKNGFTFWIYSTVAINGNDEAKNIVDGCNNQFGESGIKVQANTWTKITVEADDINGSGRFLIIQGSTAGTIYIDDICPL